MNKFSRWIEKKGWEHHRFLLMITLSMLLSLLFFALLLLSWTYSGFLSQQALQIILLDVGQYVTIGLISGIVLGGILLIQDYRKKRWDVHKVVSKFLKIFFVILIITYVVLTIFGMIFTNFALKFASFNLGFGLGGIISLLLFTFEIKKNLENEKEV